MSTWKERFPERLPISGEATDSFYETDAWYQLRYRVLKKYEGCCQCCGQRGSFSRPLHVDHIKPRSKYPALELDIENLQVLCKPCNLGKGNRDETDWRPVEAPSWRTKYGVR